MESADRGQISLWGSRFHEIRRCRSVSVRRVDRLPVGPGLHLRQLFHFRGPAQGPVHGQHLCERLWRSLKYEEVYLNAYATVAEAKTGIGAWLGFYNPASSHHLSIRLNKKDFVDRDAVPRGVLRGSLTV
jgi:hypothetical protein